MNFDKLNAMVPYARGGKAKILEMHPYNAITLRLPGRHAESTFPIGGDFVVCVDDENMDWVEHQFTHADLFTDIEQKAWKLNDYANDLMLSYLKIVQGSDPAKFSYEDDDIDGIHPQTLMYAVQCLAVAEHRRYPQHEDKFGGRYLPFRAAAGIVEGLWTAMEASEKTRKMGRPGVEWLEKESGLPKLTKELMG